MAEVRVRLPLGALESRTWESLVFRVLREHESAGSNPAVLTRLRWGLCWYGQAPVKRHGAGSIPATAAWIRKVKPTGDGSRPESGRAMSLEGSTPSPSALRALGRPAEAPAFQAGEAGSTPGTDAQRWSWHSRGSVNGRPPGFEPGDGGSIPSPRTSLRRDVSGTDEHCGVFQRQDGTL